MRYNERINCVLYLKNMEPHIFLRMHSNGNLHYRLNFDPGKTNKIFHHNSKEHVKISRIAKFGGEML